MLIVLIYSLRLKHGVCNYLQQLIITKFKETNTKSSAGLWLFRLRFGNEVLIVFYG